MVHRGWRRLHTLLWASIITTLWAPVDAQGPSSGPWQRHTTIFVSNGSSGDGSVLHFGAGLEWIHRNGFGIIGEIGPRFRHHELSALDDLMLSIAGTYHFRLTSGRRLTPFLVGGFAYAFEPVPDPGPAYSFVDVGGGILYRVGDNGGVRLEVRDAELVGSMASTGRYWGVRAGYTWIHR